MRSFGENGCDDLSHMLSFLGSLLREKQMKLCESFRFASDANKIDAVAVSPAVWQVVTQMSSIDTDTFTVLETANILPDDLLVAETGPAMSLALRN